MGPMQTYATYRCPDCGASVHLPPAAGLAPGRSGEAWVRISLREFNEALERHVRLNPRQHPTFVVTNWSLQWLRQLVRWAKHRVKRNR